MGMSLHTQCLTRLPKSPLLLTLAEIESFQRRLYQSPYMSGFTSHRKPHLFSFRSNAAIAHAAHSSLISKTVNIKLRPMPYFIECGYDHYAECCYGFILNFF